MDFLALSKEVSYALRHAPQEYDLELDENGWTDMGKFISTLRKKETYKNLSEQDIFDMIDCSIKKRHECQNGRIRAIYGHSVEKMIVRNPQNPPNILYHGTARRFIDKILYEGLTPQERQYVHLSEDIETAIEVGKRHDTNPVILKVESSIAYSQGIQFFHANEKIWLVEKVPPKYLKIV